MLLFTQLQYNAQIISFYNKYKEKNQNIRKREKYWEGDRGREKKRDIERQGEGVGESDYINVVG